MKRQQSASVKPRTARVAPKKAPAARSSKAILVSRSARGTGATAAERDARLVAAQAQIAKIAHSALPASGSLALIRRITEIAALAGAYSEVCYWRFGRGGAVMELVSPYQLQTRQHTSERPSIVLQNRSPYLQTLNRHAVVVLHDARKSDQTRDFNHSYNIPFKVFSSLEVAVKRDDDIVGVLCFDQTGKKRRWTTADQLFIVAAGAAITQLLRGERKQQKQDEHDENEIRLRQVTENIQEVFWMDDLVSGKTLYVSQAYETIMCRPKEELFEDTYAWLKYVHTEDRERMRALARYDRNGGVYDTAYRIIRPDGEIRWLEECTFPVYDKDGKARRVAGTTRDITEQVLQQRQISEQRQQLQSILDAVQAEIWCLDASGRVKQISHRSLTGKKYNEKYCLGKTTSELTPDSAPAQKYHEMNLQVARTGVAKLGNTQTYTRADGSPGWALVDVVPLPKQDGKPQGLIVFKYDATELKQTENDLSTLNSTLKQRVAERTRLLEVARWALKEREANVQALLTALPDPVFRYDTEGKCLGYVSGTYDMLLPEEMITGSKIKDAPFTENDRRNWLRAIRQCAQTGATQAFEYSLPLKGKPHFYEARVSRINTNEVMAVVRDVSLYKNLELSLREQQQRLEEAQRLGRIGTWEIQVDAQGLQLPQTLVYSQSAYDMLGLDEQALPPHTDILSQQIAALTGDLSPFNAQVEALIRDGGSLQCQVQALCADGTILNVEEQVIAVRDPHAQHVCKLVGIFQDVSERHQHQAALVYSELRLRTIIDTLPQPVYVKDAHGKYLLFNQAAAAVYGAPAEKMLGLTDQQLAAGRFDADYVQMIRQQDQEVISRQRAYTWHNVPFVTGGGQAITFNLTKVPMRLPDGELGVLAIAQHLSGQQHVQQKIDLLTTAVNSLITAHAALDAEGKYFAISDSYARELGYTPRELMGQNWRLTVSPEDYAKSEAAYQQMLEVGLTWAELRGIRKDGSKFVQQVMMTAAYDAQGIFTGHHCLMRVTQQKIMPAEW